MLSVLLLKQSYSKENKQGTRTAVQMIGQEQLLNERKNASARKRRKRNLPPGDSSDITRRHDAELGIYVTKTPAGLSTGQAATRGWRR